MQYAQSVVLLHVRTLTISFIDKWPIGKFLLMETILQEWDRQAFVVHIEYQTNPSKNRA
jgi:hypothetical protein